MTNVDKEFSFQFLPENLLQICISHKYIHIKLSPEECSREDFEDVIRKYFPHVNAIQSYNYSAFMWDDYPKRGAAILGETSASYSNIMQSDKHVIEFIAAPSPLPEPPAQLEWLVGFIVSKAQREDVLGDLTEDFNADLKAGMSAQRARRRYSTRACATIRDQLWPAIKRLGVWGMILKMFAS
ncbi:MULTISPECIES: hypothetical protein [Asticcacaulis]|uniref:hypothetical protein n=1 Tax=Asticcacaulis TaxID=76890 RepID=UPI001AE1F1BE|nr:MULTISPECIES: hypothetical protein [Asticcacaulis]MBP2161311.1 hypothetical protein [Asticcacaulis solisilvae]MDR6802323.1 hypothetical protein [Asticcacaulis sp. BE141]